MAIRARDMSRRKYIRKALGHVLFILFSKEKILMRDYGLRELESWSKVRVLIGIYLLVLIFCLAFEVDHAIYAKV